MSALVRSLVLAIPLLSIAGCIPPPSGPAMDAGYAPNARAQGFIDAQLASHPNGTEPGMTGTEAVVIYRNYLRSIGSHPIGGDGSQGAGGSGGAGAGAAGTPPASSGGSGGSYP